MGYLNEVAQSFWEPSGDLSGLRHAIGTLGYLQTLRAPTIRLHPAIFPWVCADRSAYANADFAAMESVNLAAWVRSGARRVGAYDYWYGVDYTVPRVSFRAQADAIRSVHAAGVVGWYAELAPLWAFDAPKAWLGAKLFAGSQPGGGGLARDLVRLGLRSRGRRDAGGLPRPRGRVGTRRARRRRRPVDPPFPHRRVDLRAHLGGGRRGLRAGGGRAPLACGSG